VVQTEDGYQTTIEGITFTLIGSDQLEQVVGESVQIQGELAGTWITVTGLSP
jgi:hypothetical protein